MLKPHKDEPSLYFAARLIRAEIDDLIDSAPRGWLFQMERIAQELIEIEDRL